MLFAFASARWPRGVVFAVAALALALRLLVPAGFMPVFDGHRLTLTVCTGHGPVRLAAAHGDTVDAPCGFDILATPLLGGGVFARLADRVVPLAATVVRPAWAMTAVRTRRLPPSRAPPEGAAIRF